MTVHMHAYYNDKYSIGVMIDAVNLFAVTFMANFCDEKEKHS